MNKLCQYHPIALIFIQAATAKCITRILMATLLAISLLPSQASHASDKTKLPKDIATFIKNRDGCDHFRGEEPYNKERQQFLEKQMRQLCTGTDKKLQLLKLKYKSNEKIMGMLNQYEEQIEGGH